jgi:hypothetical protein
VAAPGLDARTGVPDARAAGQVEDAVGARQCIAHGHVALDQVCGEAREARAVGLGLAVDGDDRVAGVQERGNECASDEAGRAGHYRLHGPPPDINWAQASSANRYFSRSR